MVLLFRFALFAVLVALGHGGVAWASGGRVPVIAADGDGLVVTGLEPGAGLVFLGVAHARPTLLSQVVRQLELVEDRDRDGAVRIEAQQVISNPAVFALLGTAGEPTALIPAEGRELLGTRLVVGRQGEGRGSTTLVVEGAPLVELVLVRRPLAGVAASAGTWAARLGDGSDLDLGGPGDPDGVIEVALDALAAFGSSAAAPESLAVGDLLVVVDPLDLAAGLFELGEEGWVAR